MTATTQHWVRTWGAAPHAPGATLGSLDAHPPLADVTLRQVVRVSGGGHQVRVRLTNEYGTAPLTVGAARLGLAAPGGAVVAGSDRPLTFTGRPGATVPAGAALLSDPVALPVAALTRLSVSLYLPAPVAACTCHDPVLDTGWTIPGDAVAAATLPPGAGPLPVRALIAAVDVLADGPAAAIAVLGDSRVDGVGSTPDANRGWPDRLAERLAGCPGRYVVNQGVSGNRLCRDGLGTAALARFDRDVLATPGLGYVVVSVGGNDLTVAHAPRDADPELAAFLAMFPGDPVTTGEVIAGYRQLVTRAHARGVPVYATTIAPFEGGELCSAAGEHARQSVNTWIRTGGAFDAVLDFDAVWRDPARPSRIRDGFHHGDHLHGSDTGYRALADSVDLSLFGTAIENPSQERKINA